MFNTSTRKEDMSLKLRSHNLKNAKHQTKQLEKESRKMEDRLQELKLAMNREKEERVMGGGGFWSSGQEGNLNNYAEEVLNKPSKISSATSNRGEKGSAKKKRVKVSVLRDEPIKVPERKKAPGTMANIAKRDLVPNKEKIKGPKCGQCEQKAANVSCQECGEDYCAGCFAAFHMKGALKKHRSIPIGSIGMQRPNLTPRSAPSVEPPKHADIYNNYTSNGRYSPAGSSHSNSQNGQQHSLLDGDYDEQANAEDFAAALAEWRAGKAGASKEAPPQQQPAQPKVVVPRRRSEMASHTTSMESGTSTQEEKPPPIEIKFKSSLTYAERLLLKKHRRTDQGMSPIVAPENNDCEFNKEPLEEHVQFDEVYGLITPRGGAMDPFSESAHIMPGSQDHVFHTTHDELTNRDPEERSESSLSIVMVDDAMPAYRLRKYEQSSNYEVTEGPDDTQSFAGSSTHEIDRAMWELENSRVSPNSNKVTYAFATPPTSGRPSPSGRRPASSRRSYTISPISAALKHSKEDIENVDMTIISTNVLLRKTGDQSARGTPTPSAQGNTGKTPRAKSSAAKQRPMSRTKSRAGSRVGSRAETRHDGRPKSRTWMYGEGNLTKGPSDSLKEIARLAGHVPAVEYEKADLSSFFTVGVKPMPPQERVMTPSGQRKKKDAAGIEKWSVSNKLYSMGPRSWRPDSSLGDAADETQVCNYLQDPTVAEFARLTDDVVKDMMTPREHENSTLSWSWSQQMGDDHLKGKDKDTLLIGSEMGPSRSNTQYSLTEQRQATSMTSRERSQLMQEKRHKAFRQSEDLFPTSPPPIARSLRTMPLATGDSSRPGTPRTPRPNSRGVTRPDSGRPGSRTPLQRPNSSLYVNALAEDGNNGRFTPSRPYSASGRESRAIVVDGDDLTRFDELTALQNQRVDDEEAIGQLEWELASQEGRITAEGKISRMSLIDPDAEIDIPEDTSPGRGLDSPPMPDTDLLDRQLRESVLMDDFTEMEDQFMADEVKALH